jgi:hypothetical protein
VFFSTKIINENGIYFYKQIFGPRLMACLGRPTLKAKLLLENSVLNSAAKYCLFLGVFRIQLPGVNVSSSEAPESVSFVVTFGSGRIFSQ